MSTEVMAYQGNHWSREQLDVMRATVAAGTSPAEFALFLEVCKHRKLNPFNREIYVIPNKGKMTFQVSIDGLRLLAERSGKYQGQLGPFWCGKEGEWREVWLEDKPPMAAKVGVIRSDFKEPIFSVAKFTSYAGTTPIWQKMPDLMLAKCAESLALRRAFPDQMAGLYTHEEMGQAENDLPATVLSQETIEGEVIEETTQEPLILGKLFLLGKERGLWSDTSVGKFYSLASAVLGGIPINNKSKLDQGQLLQVQAAIMQEAYTSAGTGK